MRLRIYLRRCCLRNGVTSFSLGEASDLVEEGNDMGSSHPMRVLLFSPFFLVRMPPWRAEEEESPAVVGRHRYPLSSWRLTKQINLGSEEKPFR